MLYVQGKVQTNISNVGFRKICMVFQQKCKAKLNFGWSLHETMKYIQAYIL